jgi:hypothetical protein
MAVLGHRRGVVAIRITTAASVRVIYMKRLERHVFDESPDILEVPVGNAAQSNLQ